MAGRYEFDKATINKLVISLMTADTQETRQQLFNEIFVKREDMTVEDFGGLLRSSGRVIGQFVALVDAMRAVPSISEAMDLYIQELALQVAKESSHE